MHCPWAIVIAADIMSKNLIIVESPAKVRTIKKFLGPEYLVEASVGHVRDLPHNTMGVDEEHDFTPHYQVISGKNKVVNKLKSAASKADQVYLAPDPDREGEAIAWHVSELIKGKNTNLRRIQFNEITPRAVREALEHPRSLDEKLFHSQQARRILDRLVGYKVSPLLWQKVKRGISAGRVQSVALRLIVEREKERQVFVPQEYWLFKARVEGAPGSDFTVELWKVKGRKPEVADLAAAETLEAEVRDAGFTVEQVEEKERSRHAKPPYITSTLQQDAANRLHFSAKKTMTLAQRLYEGLELGDLGTVALITYMRTDSFRVANEARDAAREWIGQNLGPEYVPEKPNAYRSKGGAQDAHEAVRPVDATLTPEMVKNHLSRDLLRLYTLIWRRFVASQMAPARFWDTVVTVRSATTQWRAKGERIIFPGFMKVYQTEAQQDVVLPRLTKDQPLDLLELSKEQKFTQPPPRFSEASLVRSLEEKGIGRPSTYAQIISTLQDREYVRLESRAFVPTELGFTVCDLLLAHFPRFMDYGFTADMEKSLDQVAEGTTDWVGLLKGFAREFDPALEKAKSEMAAVKGGKETDISCQVCGRPMVIKFGRQGEFLACSGYPECTNTSNFVRDEQGTIQIVQPDPLELQKVGTCPKCGRDLVVKRSRTGSRFIACTGYPECRHTESFTTGVACPQEGCPGELVEKSSKRGKVFYACNQFPKCQYAVWDWPVAEPCPTCGSPVLVRKSTKSGERIACPKKGCRYSRKAE